MARAGNVLRVCPVVGATMEFRSLSALSCFVFLAACGPSADPLPLAEKQAEIESVAKKTPEARTFVVHNPESQVGFAMQAPFEKQEGEVPPNAVSGEIEVDPSDLTKSTGLVNVDISNLVIYQQRATDEGAYGEREKSDLQNEHMRVWLEIGEDAPASDADKNKLVQFALENVEDVSPPDITAVSGAERKVTFTAVGEFRLHQRVAKKRVVLEALFHYDGDVPTSVDIRTVEPLKVELAEHDVRPRKGFGQLAEKTLDMMAPKVGKEAEVSIPLTLRPKT